MTRIPFTLPDVGLREISGTLILTATFLIIEIEDALLGEFDRDVVTIEIEPAALSEVRLRKRPLKDRLVLRPTGSQLLEALPGDHVREVELHIWRKYRGKVVDLVAELQSRGVDT